MLYLLPDLSIAGTIPLFLRKSYKNSLPFCVQYVCGLEC